MFLGRVLYGPGECGVEGPAVRPESRLTALTPPTSHTPPPSCADTFSPFDAFDLQHQRRHIRRPAQQLHRLFPVDRPAARPQMLVALACDCREHGSERIRSFSVSNACGIPGAMCACPTSKHTPISVNRAVRSNSTIASGVESSFGMFSTSTCTPNGLANARKCSSEVMAESASVRRALSAHANVLHQELKRRLLGDFDRALDLVHRRDAVPLLHGCNVQRRRAARAPIRRRRASANASSGTAIPVLRNQFAISRTCCRSE